MLILAIDTSGKQGSITLARGDESSFSLIETTPVEGGTFSAQLVPQIAALLARHQLRKEQIDAFAAATGPGSFTGLRVGLAAIKALAEVLRKPIAAVSLLRPSLLQGSRRKESGKRMPRLRSLRCWMPAGTRSIAASTPSQILYPSVFRKDCCDRKSWRHNSRPRR